jgi:hypothetical protein
MRRIIAGLVLGAGTQSCLHVLLRGHSGTLAQASDAQSGFSRGDHFGDASLGAAGEQRRDVLPHPGSANLARNAIRVLRCRELQDQDQMRLIDLRDSRREGARIDHELHPLPRRLDSRIGHGLAQTEVVDDNVQGVDAIAWSVRLTWARTRERSADEAAA